MSHSKRDRADAWRTRKNKRIQEIIDTALEFLVECGMPEDRKSLAGEDLYIALTMYGEPKPIHVSPMRPRDIIQTVESVIGAAERIGEALEKLADESWSLPPYEGIVANAEPTPPSPLNDAPSAVNGVADAIEAAIVSQCGDVAREAIDSGRMAIVTVGFDQPKASESEPVEMSDNSGQLPADPIAELVARIAEIERELEIHRAFIIDANPIEECPAVETAIDNPIIAKPKRSPAHVRAIMIYLRMRKERARMRSNLAIGQMQYDERVHELKLAKEGWNKAAGDASIYGAQVAELKHRRRRAVLFARDLQKRLNAEHRLVDKLTAAKREMVADLCAARDELAAAKRSISAVEKAKTRELDWAIGKQMVAERLAELRARNVRVA